MKMTSRTTGIVQITRRMMNVVIDFRNLYPPEAD
jgi:hypothetical protein